MNDIDREDTKPIKILSDEEIGAKTRSEKNANIDEECVLSRSEKYKETLEDDVNVNDPDSEEQAEEALAEKNINEAEEILKEEEEKKKDLDEPQENVKGIKKLINKFIKLDKKKKIMIIGGVIIFLAIIIILIILLVGNKKVEEVKPKEEEKAPVIVDNFYYKDGYLHFLNESEDEIGSYECANKDESLCYVAFNKYRDYFNTSKVINNGEETEIRVPIYNDNYVFVYDNSNLKDNKIVMYSISDEKELDTYLDVKAYDDGYIVYSNMSNQYGLLKIENDEVTNLVNPVYSYLGMIDGKDNLIAGNSKGLFVIDEKGKELSSILASSYQIKDYSNDLIVALSGDEYNVYNYSGDLLAGGYSFASVIDGYMGLVDSDNKIYIKDKENNKLNEEGISLKNKEYVKTYVYSEDSKGASIKQSYVLEAKEENLTIAIYPSDFGDPNYTNLSYDNIKVGKKYKYLNYFNNKLYFYKDETKNELIGSYTCANSNSISDDGTLSNCYPAKETVYEDNESYVNTTNRDITIPMIYNKYVFISDGNNNVILYDLVNNKTIGTYASVSSYVDCTDGSFTNIDKDVTFIGLNKKGSYGMVSLSSDSATSKIKFNYNKLEKFNNNYILAQNQDNKWLLIYGNIDSTSSTFDGKIQAITTDKTYFKISSGSNYYVYNNNGTKAVSSEFKYVNMYSTFFIGVDSSNMLNVYDYTGKKLGGEGIKVSGTSCSVGEFATASVNGSNYNISICSNGSSYEKHTLSNSSKEDEKEDGKDNNEQDNNSEEGNKEQQ